MKIKLECECGTTLNVNIEDIINWCDIPGNISIIPSIDHVSICCKNCNKEIQISEC